MKHELEARTIHGMEDKINELKAIIYDMHSDFIKCARGVSPCFFCANDSCCNNQDERTCNFIWNKHN